MNKIICILIVFVVLLSGCGNMSAGLSSAQSEVVVFHKRFNSQNTTAIVAAADSDMLKATPKKEIVEFIDVVYKKLGKTVDSKMVNYNVRTFNMQTSAVLVQDTTFEKGKGSETFCFRISGGKASLISYNINSKELIMN